MKKKVIKGWVSRSCATPSEIMEFGCWNGDDDPSLRFRLYDVFRARGRKSDWREWPPKKVVITIEMEED